MTGMRLPFGRRAAAALMALGLALAAAPSLAAETGAPAAGPVNVNTASAEELQRLPGIGEARARAIVEMREQRGGFRSVDELVEVRGIGEAALERLRPHVTVGGGTRSAR